MEQESISEAKALADLIPWSKDCPAWQRDALRRLCAKATLDDSDLDELTALCKNMGKGAAPLAPEHVPDPAATTTVVNLRAIHGSKNVNALKPGERLTFAKTGLTVVYGDNGSGKSGYARILRQVCRARIDRKNDTIRTNIYSKESGPQEAVIDFSADGEKKSDTWTAGTPSDPLLSSVSVFDSRTANVHVDTVNDVAYTPFPMQVLERLAEACKEIKKRIGAEISELERQTPTAITTPKCHSGTAVGTLIAGLSDKTKEQEVRDLATLTDEEKGRLEALKSDLGNDPAKVAAQIEGLTKRLDRVTSPFKTLQAAIDDQRIQRLEELYRSYRAAQDAAAAAASVLFDNEPLPDVGSQAWRALWEAARRYSEQQAFPDERFPFTDQGARCVLCHQELDEEAAGRLNRFEAFVKDETKRQEEEARVAYQRAHDSITAAHVPAKDIPALVSLIRHEIGDEELAASARHVAVMLKWRLRWVLRSHTDDEDDSPPVADPWPADSIVNP